MPEKNYYQILGICKTASKEEIHKAYRKMIKKVHTDINDSPNANEEMGNVIDAYKTLSDEDKRKEYDIKLKQEEIKRQEVKITKKPVYTRATAKAKQSRKISLHNINWDMFNFVTDFNIDHNATNYDFGNKDDYKKSKIKKF